MNEERTIAELSSEYLEEKGRRRRRSTVDGYRSSISLHVLPRFGGVPIGGIEPEEIQAWVDSFERPGAAVKAYKCLRQVIRWSIRRHRMRVCDPTIGVEIPSRPVYRPQVLDARQTVERLRGFWGHRDEATVLLSTTLGLRPGEAYAVTWERIDMRSGAVKVRESRQCVGGEVVTLPPKTEKSDRVTYLPRFALDRLREIWRGMGKPRGLVNPDSPQAIARRVKAHCASAGLPHVSMTNLRHTWATLAIEAGVQIETVALMLGHSSIMTAYNHYIRPRKGIYQAAQSAVQEYLFSCA